MLVLYLYKSVFYHLNLILLFAFNIHQEYQKNICKIISKTIIFLKFAHK